MPARIYAAVLNEPHTKEMKPRTHLDPKKFRKTVDGKKTDLFFISNKNGISVSVTSFGAKIVEIFTPDKNGRFADIALGYSSVADYAKPKDERFFGATVGRYANRIANGKFTLDGRTYTLPQNNGKNCLHGGLKGLDMKVWDAVQTSEASVTFTCFSPDGEEGFPGNLHVSVRYSLTEDNALLIEYAAFADARTPVNITHHTFFNLCGAGAKSIAKHILTINADSYTPIDKTLIPTGKIASVKNTPLDFRTPHAIGERIDAPFEQLEFGNGYDHNWVLNRRDKTLKTLEFAARVVEPASGRTLEVYTTQPGMQFYAGNFLEGKKQCKSGKKYPRRSAFALETQHFPDSPNKPQFPSTILNPKDAYIHVCEYKFGTINNK